jgi:hypothetical protein
MMEEIRPPRLKSEGLRLKIHAPQESIRQPIFCPCPAFAAIYSHDPGRGQEGAGKGAWDAAYITIKNPCPARKHRPADFLCGCEDTMQGHFARFSQTGQKRAGGGNGGDGWPKIAAGLLALMLDCVATMKEIKLAQLKREGLRLKIHAPQENIRQPIFFPCIARMNDGRPNGCFVWCWQGKITQLIAMIDTISYL